ncbi:Cyclic di-GMP phosphodiesterase Gmr [Caloramator mitchellensis]|uniref:Cyclic di-GMP phosphodiesterase Gmr n=1 Tax=Caloramator mitchellensis TaxID=908809 RepID=A0A0R3JT79_CALMK|nr:EAL domain-containing protein [Caloramator mitchellensis]KRQ86721.1 Cyclic di-GMP phosphodiesterase Gmr [Caloramator mitchellensis]
MSIINKILIYITITVTSVLLFIIGASNYFILEPIYKLEDSIANSDIKRLNRHVNNELNLIYNLSLDYSKWDETYNFVINKNTDYITSNYYYDISFDKNGINFIFITDRNGNILYERYNQNSNMDIQLNKSINHSIKPILEEFIIKNTADSSGINFINNTPVLLSIQKITKSDDYDNYNGYYIVGKYINPEEIEEIKNATALDINSILSSSIIENKTIKDYDTITAYLSFKDVLNKPSSTFILEINRQYYLETLKNLKILLILYLLFVGLVVSVLLYKLKKDVFNRILHIQNIINNITKTSNYSLRIPVKGKDEIALFSKNINLMLDNLHESNEKLRESIDEIYHLAYFDQLTQMPNRQHSMSQIDTLIKKNIKFTTFLIDIDNFKNINDVYGHDFGDIIIKYIAKRIRTLFKRNAFISRIGGDEFLLIFENLHGTYRIQNAINDIIGIFEKPLHFKNENLFVSASIGIAEFPKDANSMQAILKNAEIAMYEAKKNKTKYCYFDPSMNEKAMTNVYLINNLKQALENEEFLINYQPIYNINENKVTGAEGLIRWRKGDKIIPPNQFVPIAKELGLIVDIDNWVLKESCKQCKVWHEMGYKDFTISVNTSFKQLIDSNFISYIENTLKELNLEPNSLILEITEDEALEDIDRVADILNKIKRLGVKIAIDDFGTGYSSLIYISRLPIDLIKVDRSLINDIENTKNLEIIKSIAHLAKALDISIIVEGVENERQLVVLKHFNIDKIQGYFIGKPVVKTEFEKNFLKKA